MDKMEFFGVVEDHAHDIFKVRITDNHVVKAKLSGKMRINKINLQVGDKVKVEVSPYDMNTGRIVSRTKTGREHLVSKDELDRL